MAMFGREDPSSSQQSDRVSTDVDWIPPSMSRKAFL